jgi:hypothetical protein
MRDFLTDLAITVPVAFVSAALATFVYSLVAHGSGAVDWGTAVELAVVLGIAIAVVVGNGGRRPIRLAPVRQPALDHRLQVLAREKTLFEHLLH